MERGAISVESETERQALGESVATVLGAEARDDAPVTYFVLRAEGANAGLDEAALSFDGRGQGGAVRRGGTPYRAPPGSIARTAPSSTGSRSRAASGGASRSTG